MACTKDDQNFCEKYLALKPSEGGFFDIVQLMFSSNVERNKFVECTEGMKVKDFRLRWLICVSVMAQKVLMFLAKPMSWLGIAFEAWLNILDDNNDSIFELLVNLFRGKLEVPDPTSSTYRSSFGNLDKRVDLVSPIIIGGSGDNAELAIMAAKLSYENQAFVQATVTTHWKMEFLGFYNFWDDYQERFTTQAFMCQDKRENPELIVVAFRGTEPFALDSWQTDVDFSWYELQGMGRIHGGFLKALGLQKGKGWPKEPIDMLTPNLYAYYTIREKLREILGENDNAKVILTGHSLGGAIAILFPVLLAMQKEEWLLKRLEGIYTFGQPRVGDGKLVEFMKEHLQLHNIKYLRFVYCNDVVPRLPYDDLTHYFTHFGTCLYFDSFYRGKIVGEEPNKNYFSIFRAIPKLLNAIWELIRSFIIGHVKGAEYHEGWFLRLYRVVGLIIPGLPAHGPQDYVNSIRLGLPSIQMPQPAHDQPGLKLE